MLPQVPTQRRLVVLRPEPRRRYIPHSPRRVRNTRSSTTWETRARSLTSCSTEVSALSGIASGADVTCRIRKHYVGYFRAKKSFFTVELQKQRTLIYLTLDLGNANPWRDHVMCVSDVTSEHFGMGNLEYSLSSTAQPVDATVSTANGYFGYF